jgi:hypothetical protein
LQGHHFGRPSLDRPWLAGAPSVALKPIDSLPPAAAKRAAHGD